MLTQKPAFTIIRPLAPYLNFKEYEKNNTPGLYSHKFIGNSKPGFSAGCNKRQCEYQQPADMGAGWL